MNREQIEQQITEEQDHKEPETGTALFSLEDFKKRYKKQWDAYDKKFPKVEYPFQELGIEIARAFPKQNLWYIFHKDGFTEKRIKYAFKETQKRGKDSNYMLAIIQRCIRENIEPIC